MTDGQTCARSPEKQDCPQAEIAGRGSDESQDLPDLIQTEGWDPVRCGRPGPERSDQLRFDENGHQHAGADGHSQASCRPEPHQLRGDEHHGDDVRIHGQSREQDIPAKTRLTVRIPEKGKPGPDHQQREQRVRPALLRIAQQGRRDTQERGRREGHAAICDPTRDEVCDRNAGGREGNRGETQPHL